MNACQGDARVDLSTPFAGDDSWRFLSGGRQLEIAGSHCDYGAELVKILSTSLSELGFLLGHRLPDAVKTTD